MRYKVESLTIPFMNPSKKQIPSINGIMDPKACLWPRVSVAVTSYCSVIDNERKSKYKIPFRYLANVNVYQVIFNAYMNGARNIIVHVTRHFL